MKGSDKWGRGSGPRVDIVVGVLLAISVLGVAFYYLENERAHDERSGRGRRDHIHDGNLMRQRLAYAGSPVGRARTQASPV